MASDEGEAGGHEAVRPGGPPSDTGNGEFGVCSRCHQPLTRRTASGGCLRCMMSVAALDDPMEPGTGTEEVRRYSHFEIMLAADGSLDELGHGTMGTTYRAQDTVLQSPVALKVIGRNVADSPKVRTRFLREARSAARLRHPNVASVFHYGEQEGECFYVMELVEGETLEERMRRDGPLPPALVLEIGAQVARALGAAETQGLVHRDLKPSNIMLVAAQTRTHDESNEPVFVKVIDFGLAKAVAASEQETAGESETQHGFVGTPAYASPEQFAHNGKDGRVDTRADIYSLGVTLWYLLSGRTPFRGHTVEEIHSKQVGDALPLQQLTTRRVPSLLVSLLRSMLAVDPGARPQSARELLESLLRCQTKLASARRNRWVGAWAVAIALVFGFSVSAAVYWVLERSTDTTRAVKLVDRSVAVLPFQNLSPDPADAFFTTGVQDEITADLARIAELKVSSPSSAKGYPPGRRDFAAIGRELGVANLLEGSARREGGQINIELRLVNLRDPSHPWTRKYNRRLTEIFAVQGEIARAVADQLQASLSVAEKASINRPPTNDPVAYDLFLRAAEFPQLRPDVASVCRDALSAIALLDQAIARDPNFTRAYCSLAKHHDYLWSRRYKPGPGERDVDHRSLAESALQKARTLEPDSGDVHLALANHLHEIGDSEQAGIEVDLACRLLPNSAPAHYFAGSIAMQVGQMEKSQRFLERAVALDPMRVIDRWMLAIAYGYERRGEECDHAYADLISRATGDDKTLFVFQRALGVLESRADLAPLRATVADLSAANDPDGESRFKAGLILKLFEHDADEASQLLAGSGKAKFSDGAYVYPKEWFEALVGRMRHDPAAAEKAFTAARSIFEKGVTEEPRNYWNLSYLAMTDAGLGRKDDAVREGLRACELCPYEKNAMYAPAVHCNLAVVYAWTGQTDLALDVLGEAADRPAGDGYVTQLTYGDLQLNPVWDSLRTDPRFAALVDRLAPKSPR